MTMTKTALHQIRFSPTEKSLFFPTLRKRVDDYFQQKEISRNANAEMILKTVILLSGYIVPFIFLVFFQTQAWLAAVLWILMGICMAGIGMSVMHDANHGAYSSRQKVNDWIGYSLNLLGGAAFNWKIQHNHLHHTFTNISSHDEDIKDRAIMKFNPHSKRKPIQTFQHYYAFFFYGLITLYWVLAKDLVQFFLFKKLGVNKNSRMQNLMLLIRMSLMKISYFSLMILIPLFVIGKDPLSWIGGFLLMHFTAGIILTLIFQMAHSVEGTVHPLADEDGKITSDWAVHQMQTTVNFSRDNRLLSWYIGGLNYQIEHHLFPRICHVHYPALSSIVEKTAQEFGIHYLENKSFGEAFFSHVRYLKKLGSLPSMNEAIA
jgi:linoleoyl-CoA desaturase